MRAAQRRQVPMRWGEGGGCGVAGRWGPGVRMTVDLGWWWVVGDLTYGICGVRNEGTGLGA